MGDYRRYVLYPLPVSSIIPRIAGTYWPPEKSGSPSGTPAGGYRIPCEIKQEKFYSRNWPIPLVPGTNFFESQFSKMAFSGMLLPPKGLEMGV